MNKRGLAAVGVAAALLVGGGVVANETLLAGCGADVCVGDSWQAKYVAAQPGAVLSVQAGTHAGQTFTVDPAKTSSADVVFMPAGGAVTVNGITSGTTSGTNGARHLTIRDVKVGGSLVTRPGSEDLTFERIDAGGFNISGGNGINILGGDYGPVASGPGHIKQGAQNVLLDGVLFHDFTITNPDKHSECILLWEGSRNVTVRNSVFRNCTDYGILVKPGFDLVFENNFFDIPMPGNTATQTCNPNCPRGGPSLALSEGARITVRSNTLLGSLRRDPEVTSVTIQGNLVSASPSLFVDGSSNDGSLDLHLRAGASAIDADLSATFPAKDIDGQARPIGPRPDLGADEFGGTTPPPDPTTTTEPPPTTTEPPPTTTEPPPTTTEPPPTTTEPPAPTDRDIFCSEYVPNAQAESNYGKWLAQNPGEKSRWEPYRDAVCAGQSPAVPMMLTPKGKGLVAAGRMAT